MLSRIDWIIIAVYLAIVATIGIASRGRQTSSRDYFMAEGSFKGLFGSLLVGLSIAASYFSGITFLAYPGIVYAHGLAVLVGLVPFGVAGLVLRFYFLPRYLGQNPSRPYDVIERQFGAGVRSMAGWLFVLARIAWMGTLIYAPTMAVMAATGVDPRWFWPIVLVIGAAGTVYTVLGGLRSVIITDAIQILVIIGALLVLVCFVLFHLPVGLGEAVGRLQSAGKLDWFRPSIDPRLPFTFWAVMFGISIGDIGNYIGDQMSLQRYLTQRSTRATMRSFLINITGTIITLLLLAAVGFLLAIWYAVRPDSTMPKGADRMLPYFVATQLPPGVAGLLLAAILAATLSTMSSGINALAGSIMMDFHIPGLKGLSPRREVLVAKSISLSIGLIATVAAGLVAGLGQLFDIIQRLLGTLLAPLGLLLLLSVMHRRLRPRAVAAGIVVGCAAGGCVALSSVLAKSMPWVPAIDSLWVGPAAWASMFAVAMAGGYRDPKSEASPIMPATGFEQTCTQEANV